MSSTPSNTQNVRVRFAPSPTGQLHVGNARTALYNWLYARQKGGAYVLRIEDTDVERSEDRHEVQLIEDLKWLGLEWDEGPDIPENNGGPYAPYRQSDRMKIYHDYAERLLSEGKAYLCFCSAEELEDDRKRAMSEHRSPHYSGKCRALAITESKTRHANGEAAAIRLLIPQKPIRFHDMVHGMVEFPNDAVSDPIIVRSSGMPVYNYVVVIDDIEMKITHVIRGDDHLSNTPKQVALYEALGAQVPEFAHLSTILGADRERLSKRHGATSIANFREMGILPEALNNYLALLGWAPTGGTRETFTSQELVKEFGLDRVTPSPAVFDIQKLYWLNRHHMAAAMRDDPARIMKLAHAYFVKNGWMPAEADTATSEWFEKVVVLLIPSVDQLEDLLARASLFFDFFPSSAIDNPDNADVLETPSCPAVLHSFAAKIRAESGPLTAERFKAIMNEVKIEASAKGKELFHPVRTVITGSHSGPEFDKLIPLIETGSSLILPKKVLNMRERVDAFMHVWKP